MTSERTSAPERQSGNTQDAAMDASIEAKINAAMDRGVDLLSATLGISGADPNVVFDQVGFTAEEVAYMQRQGVHPFVRIEVGQRIMETLAANRITIGRDEALASLSAYVEAVNSGDVEPLGNVAEATDEPPMVSAGGAFADHLMELGMSAYVRSGPGGNTLLFEVTNDTLPQAFSMAKTSSRLFDDNADFQEGVVSYVAGLGGLMVDAPWISADLSTAPVGQVVDAVEKAGFSPLLIDYGHEDRVGLQLVFSYGDPDARSLTAVELVRLIERRYRDEPEFAEALRQRLFSEGPVLVFQS